MKVFNRLNRIPPYFFSNLDKLKSDIALKGHEVIDLSIGDPDLPTPNFIIEALFKGAQDKINYRYPPCGGTYEFREAVSNYYKRRFGVALDPYEEVITLIGSKEGIAHLSLALIDSDDIALVPEPSYPIYKSSVLIAGGQPYPVILSEENGFLPQLDKVDKETLIKAKIMFINYPNNPTGAVCSIDSFKDIVEFATHNDIIICNDTAYNEILFDNKKPQSLLSVEGAKEVAVELGTLSKSYNMTGWRIGYAVGNRQILKKLLAIKENMDSGQFGAIQHAGSAALNYGDGYIEYLKNVYKKRRDNAIVLLEEIGLKPILPKGTFYVWFKVPEGYSSKEYAIKLASECGVIITPGNAFGKSGEGYCRISLTVDESIFELAAEKIKKRIKV